LTLVKSKIILKNKRSSAQVAAMRRKNAKLRKRQGKMLSSKLVFGTTASRRYLTFWLSLQEFSEAVGSIHMQAD